jgi:hypothetical protein
MDVKGIQDWLTKEYKEELGIPIILPEVANDIFPLAEWALKGEPWQGRQVWFCVSNAVELRSTFPAHLRNRIFPLQPAQLDAAFKRGPFDALLLPNHGFTYADPNYTLTEFWKERGQYVKADLAVHPLYSLWSWVSKHNARKLLGLDHHHAVLWDVKQILRPLGARLDFYWLCDGRPPVNEALPCTIPQFKSSLDIYKPPVTTPLTAEFTEFVKQGTYEGVCTSHSLVTSYRLKDLGLPLFHVNSTRFGNEWIQNPEKHNTLVKSLQECLQKKQLHVLHNNKGDQQYFRQYFPYVSPQQELYVPSLCESLLRLRVQSKRPVKILIWDTRQTLLQPGGSPFMKELYARTKELFGEAIESQAVLLAQQKGYLPEGFLDEFTAVIHIPYNVSTMSITQQLRANIPVWVPSPELLETIWCDAKEPNELSWTVFTPGSERTASWMDQARDPSVVKHWCKTADFYASDPCLLQFSSIDQLLETAMTTDYETCVKKSEEIQLQSRQEIFAAWEQVLQGLNKQA